MGKTIGKWRFNMGNWYELMILWDGLKGKIETGNPWKPPYWSVKNLMVSAEDVPLSQSNDHREWVTSPKNIGGNMGEVSILFGLSPDRCWIQRVSKLWSTCHMRLRFNMISSHLDFRTETHWLRMVAVVSRLGVHKFMPLLIVDEKKDMTNHSIWNIQRELCEPAKPEKHLGPSFKRLSWCLGPAS